MNSSTRVIKNTGFLYAQKIITIIISLYSTRLILDALGVVDYGIFYLVSGVIAMLSFIKASMAVSTQRYMSFYLGSEDAEKQESIFQTSIQLHLVIGILLVILLEIAAIFLFDGFLNMPDERTQAAKIVYHFMVVSMFVTVNAVPYDAAINAHEDLFFEALTGVLESVLRLGIAFWITYYQSDKLILFGLLTALLTILIRVIKGFFCHSKYKDCRNVFGLAINRDLFKEMYSFASWNLFGALAGVGRNQGIAVILNLFYGAAINASYGIANQVSGQIRSFSSLMLKAVNPQIMKSEGGQFREKMLRLSMISSKFSFFMMGIISIPVLFEMNNLLNLWLNNVPEYAVTFCQLIVIATLIGQLTIGLQSGLQATGRIKIYQAVIGILLLLNLPVSYLLLDMGLEAYFVLVSFIVLEFFAGIIRVYLLYRIGGLNIKEYFDRVLLNILIPLLLILGANSFIIIIFNMEYRFLLTGFISVIIFLPSIYIFGLTKDEKIVINNIYNSMRRVFIKHV